jgi:hypothetical protein
MGGNEGTGGDEELRLFASFPLRARSNLRLDFRQDTKQHPTTPVSVDSIGGDRASSAPRPDIFDKVGELFAVLSLSARICLHSLRHTLLRPWRPQQTQSGVWRLRTVRIGAFPSSFRPLFTPPHFYGSPSTQFARARIRATAPAQYLVSRHPWSRIGACLSPCHGPFPSC